MMRVTIKRPPVQELLNIEEIPPGSPFLHAGVPWLRTDSGGVRLTTDDNPGVHVEARYFCRKYCQPCKFVGDIVIEVLP